MQVLHLLQELRSQRRHVAAQLRTLGGQLAMELGRELLELPAAAEHLALHGLAAIVMLQRCLQ